jgi:ketosteroid isomerase-like protein
MTMEKYRENVALRLRNSLAQSLDLIDEAMGDAERMQKASPRDLAYLMKELAEKTQLFSGGATHITTRKEEGEHAGDMDYLDRLQRASVTVEAVEQGTHHEGHEGENNAEAQRRGKEEEV